MKTTTLTIKSCKNCPFLERVIKGTILHCRLYKLPIPHDADLKEKQPYCRVITINVSEGSKRGYHASRAGQ